MVRCAAPEFVVSGQDDVLPAQRRDVPEQAWLRQLAPPSQVVCAFVHIQGLPAHDHGDDQVQGHDTLLLSVVRPISDAALGMGEHPARQLAVLVLAHPAEPREQIHIDARVVNDPRHLLVARPVEPAFNAPVGVAETVAVDVDRVLKPRRSERGRRSADVHREVVERGRTLKRVEVDAERSVARHRREAPGAKVNAEEDPTPGRASPERARSGGFLKSGERGNAKRISTRLEPVLPSFEPAEVARDAYPRRAVARPRPVSVNLGLRRSASVVEFVADIFEESQIKRTRCRDRRSIPAVRHHRCAHVEVVVVDRRARRAWRHAPSVRVTPLERYRLPPLARIEAGPSKLSRSALM